MLRSRLPFAAALALGACGSDSATDDSAGPAASAGQDAFPVTVAHRSGSTEIKSGPARVVTLGLSDQDAALALGVKPVGALSFNTVLSIPYAIDQVVPILAGGNSK